MKADIFAPPKFGVRLLELFQQPCAAENELGDLEEEYRAKAQQEGLATARKWFWSQVRSTLRITIKEDGIVRISFRAVMRRGHRRPYSLSHKSRSRQITRWSLIPPAITLLILINLLLPLIPNRQRLGMGEPPKQSRDASTQLGSGVFLLPAIYPYEGGHTNKKEATAGEIQKLTNSSLRSSKKINFKSGPTSPRALSGRNEDVMKLMAEVKELPANAGAIRIYTGHSEVSRKFTAPDEALGDLAD